MKKVLIATLLLFILPVAAVAQASNESVTTFILVRHAEKADNSHDPDLSAEGYERASLLGRMLEEIQFDAVYSTPFIRTMETAKPGADRLHLEILEYDPGNPDEVTEVWKEKHKGQYVLVAGHSNTTPTFANALLGREHFKEKFDESDYSNILIVTISADGEGHLLHMKF